MLPKKNAFLLVFAFEDISIRPELSSPPRFRIQGGGYREPYGGGQTNGRKSSAASACKLN